MPLPLMNLDTRRWADLVEEGQALITRYAPAWTDHNTHDPGITLMELLAWLTEQEIYRVNRIPERHRRKFLALAGFRPNPPQAARVVLGFTITGPNPVNLPAGLTLQTTRPDGRSVPFQIARPTTLVPANIAAVQSFDGRNFKDLTGPWRDGLPLNPFGPDPASDPDPKKQPALYLGLDAPLPAETASLYFWLPEKLANELALLLEEEQAAAARCRPNLPTANSCNGQTDASQEDDDSPATSLPAGIKLSTHHDVSLVWEYYDGANWQPLNATDETRSLTLSGTVQIDGPATMSALSVGEITDPYFYLRLRLAAGRPDVAPLLTAMGLNMAPAVQHQSPWTSFPIAPGVIPAVPPQPGQIQPLKLILDQNGVINSLTAENGPDCLVLSYQASTLAQEGELIVDLWPLNPGTGRPEQHFQLPAAPVDGQAQFWQDGTTKSWTIVPDFDAGSRTDRHLLLDNTTGLVTAGNGENGQVLSLGSQLLSRYTYTQAAEGNVIRGAAWEIDGVADTWNEALLGQPVANLTAEISQINNIIPASGGAAAETLVQVAGRLAQTLWAHERLVELVPGGVETTLDQLARSLVISRKPPQRATTLLDIERLALSIPGTHVARARAWAGLDARYPCYKAPGTVSLVILPALPLDRPTPTPGLLQTVRSYLNRRRIVGMRLVVVGPRYVEVRIEALVRARIGADPARVQGDIDAALDAFLDPLTGGPLGRGYPFGRNIYYAEMMQVIDNVSGVDHVLNLTLYADGGEGQCGNLCVGPINIPVPGSHTITVKSSTE